MSICDEISVRSFFFFLKHFLGEGGVEGGEGWSSRPVTLVQEMKKHDDVRYAVAGYTAFLAAEECQMWR